MRKTPKSRLLYERASKSLQSGVSASTRYYLPYPLYVTRGAGSNIFDVDGNKYVDCFLSAGPLLLGHSHPDVMERVKHELDRGLLMYNLDLGVECAELLKELIPCAEKVRFANTGSEANFLAVRAAKAFTAKNKVIKFYGHYHGLDDQFCVATSNVSDEAISAGISEESLKNTVLLKYNNIDAVKSKLDEDNDIAAVILDPQMDMGGLWPARDKYLEELRQLTKEREVVLIFDEIITGFRLALGGAQEYFGVTPDLATISKSVAAGAKFAAVVGKEEIMNTLTPKELAASPKKIVLHGGTYTDGTIALAAAIAAMKAYKKLKEKGEYQKLFQLAEKLKTGIEMAFKQRGVPLHINMLGPSFKLYFTNLDPNFDVYCNLDMTILSLFFLSLINEGVYLNPAARLLYLSFVHTEGDVDQVVVAINSSLERNKFEEVL